ncbi:MAG TPA: hypothetical protein VMA71_04885 [Alloacidobacterium sp.]|nr:hypothetical protein [Alloacidobacterium sp.]
MSSVKRALLIVLAATVIVIVVTAAYVYIDEKPPAAVGQIVKLDVMPIHSEMRVGAGAQGVQGGVDTYDQLLILAQVQLRNQTNVPLFLHDMWSDLTTNNGDEQRSLAANRTDFQSVFIAYPQMASFKQEPLQRDTTIQPGQSVQGLVIFHYPMTKDQWDARHGFEAVISFMHQKNLVLPWPPAGK